MTIVFLCSSLKPCFRVPVALVGHSLLFNVFNTHYHWKYIFWIVFLVSCANLARCHNHAKMSCIFIRMTFLPSSSILPACLFSPSMCLNLWSFQICTTVVKTKVSSPLNLLLHTHFTRLFFFCGGDDVVITGISELFSVVHLWLAFVGSFWVFLCVLFNWVQKNIVLQMTYLFLWDCKNLTNPSSLTTTQEWTTYWQRRR